MGKRASQNDLVRSGIFALLLIFSWSLSSFGDEEASETPAEKPTVVEVVPENQNISWVSDNLPRNLSLLSVGANPFISITDLARISESQLGWQSASEQACLSRIQSLLCLNWENSTIYLDGSSVGSKYQVRFIDNKLYVNFPFVTSKYFQKFSGTELSFNEEKKELVQITPSNLEIPPVENMGDYYRLSFNISSDNAYRVMKKEKDRLWIRIVGGQTAGSSILEGDNVIREVKVLQKRHSADLLVKLGSECASYDLQFDGEGKRLDLLVYRKEEGSTPASADESAKLPAPPAYRPKIKGGPVTAIPVSGESAPPKAGASQSKKPELGRKEKGIWTVVVDAGHGGFDSGAMGVRGTFEKDINLRVAEAVAEKLKKEKNLRVIMTRQNDLFLPLDERTKLANEAGADLFVSIHCNSSISAKHSGFEVYLLAGEASDEAAAAVARFENSVVALESKKGDKSDKLSGLLASMAVNTYINESSELAAMVCRGAKKTSTVKETSVKEANFYVLRGVQMPSVLVEMDYLSNPISELKLRSSRFTSILAKGIAQGVLEFEERQRKKEELISVRSNNHEKSENSQ